MKPWIYWLRWVLVLPAWWLGFGMVSLGLALLLPVFQLNFFDYPEAFSFIFGLLNLGGACALTAWAAPSHKRMTACVAGLAHAILGPVFWLAQGPISPEIKMHLFGCTAGFLIVLLIVFGHSFKKPSP